MAEPFSHTSPKIMILGEAYSKDEEEAKAPFVGASGRLLNSILRMVGINRDDCYVTNVFNLQPRPTNNVENLCGKKDEDVIKWLPPLKRGKYVRKEYEGEITRLYHEIETFAPTLIIALGGTAVWSLTGIEGIRKVRGAPIMSSIGVPGIKVLPSYHPSAILSDYSLRPILIADMQKARRESEFPEIIRPPREFWVEPELEDLARFEKEHILPCRYLSIDIETKQDQITCIGFATSTAVALVVPFVDYTKPGNNYWPNFVSERIAWNYVRKWCGMNKRIVGQNHMYDATFLWRQYGIPMPHMEEDTMLLHHALQPELEKGLGFLGTIYTDEPQWKFMRTGKATAKREDD